MVGEALDEFARAIAKYCQAKEKPLVLELSALRAAPASKAGIKPGLEMFPPNPAQIRRVTHLG
jgi:hypothetical protein